MVSLRLLFSFGVDMAERLSNLAYDYQGIPQQHHEQSFNPRSISLDIRSPEELAAVNEFLLSLGKDITSAHGPNRRQQSGPLTPDYRGNNLPSPSTYFDAVSLTQLGLANMPGITLPSPPPQASASMPASSHDTLLGLHNTFPAAGGGCCGELCRLPQHATGSLEYCVPALRCAPTRRIVITCGRSVGGRRPGHSGPGPGLSSNNLTFPLRRSSTATRA